MNGHDFTREQNMEARMTLAAARRGLAAAINDAENGIGHLSCDDPQIMEQVRAHWRRLYDTYMNADAILSDLESCARHLTDGDKWEPNPIADGMKPMEMAKGCACFIESRRKTTGFSRGEEVNCLNRGSSDRPNPATVATGNGRWNGTAGTVCSSSAG